MVVVDPADYGAVIGELDRPGGPSLSFKFDLARKAFAHTAAYDQSIASTLAEVTLSGGAFAAWREGPPAWLTLCGREGARSPLRREPAPAGGVVRGGRTRRPRRGGGVAGKELSYTNLLDLDAAARIVLEFSEPAAAVIKHTNPCGAATGANAADAYVRAREADALSAFGGIVALNRAIDLDAARAIVSTRIDAVIAPSVDDVARAVLAQKSQMRVVTADFSQLAGANDREVRSILGALLVQDRDRVPEASEPWPSSGLTVPTRRQPSAEEWRALRFAWRLCAHVKSNTVIFTREDRTVAIGAGQMSRVDAVQVARLKAQSIGPDALRGTVAASDAFFPFRDGLGRGGAGRCHRGGATRRVSEGRRGDCRRQRTRPGDGVYGRRHFRH
jgi:phosphoribosylaminoimidazolecarboxamide formyltransferase/IMP cyclohydrolase